MQDLFHVQVRASNRTWFIADEGANLTPEQADAMIADLRHKGFEAKAIEADAAEGEALIAAYFAAP